VRLSAFTLGAEVLGLVSELDFFFGLRFKVLKQNFPLATRYLHCTEVHGKGDCPAFV